VRERVKRKNHGLPAPTSPINSNTIPLSSHCPVPDPIHTNRPRCGGGVRGGGVFNRRPDEGSGKWLFHKCSSQNSRITGRAGHDRRVCTVVAGSIEEAIEDEWL